MWTWKFLADTAERVISSAAQAAAGSIGATAIVQDVNWRVVWGTTVVAAALSFLKALYARNVGDPNSASLVG